MAGSLQPRIKTWGSTEDVVYSDLNAEFDNVLTAMQPLLMDDYSTNVAQMQVMTDPGEVGTESLATTLAAELARLRRMIKELSGEDYWYETPVASLLGLSNAIGTGLTGNRIVSGRVLSTSNQPAFLVANGAARTVKVDGTPSSFVYYVNGTEYSITTDTTLTGLTAAPSSNNTCLIDDAVAADQYWTVNQGEDGTEIPVDTMGSEITALTGKYAAFKLDNGTTTEYFIAYVKSSTALSRARRGYFFDSADAPVPRTTYANNDTITLMKLTWVFAKSDLTLTATYNNPVWSKDEPSSPALGDYWFDLDNNTWKVYGVGSYATANATLIGVCIQDATNTVAARSFDPFKNYDALNTLELFYDSATVVKSRYLGSVVNVYGETVKADYGIRSWDITIDRDSGVSEAASTYYYFYLTDQGDQIVSNVKPHDRREDLQGFYHPHQSWRCVGRAYNDASSDLGQVESYYRAMDTVPVRSVIAADVALATDDVVKLSGASFTYYLPPAAAFRGKELTLNHAGTSLTQVYTLDGFGSETIGGSTTYGLYTNGETLVIKSDGSNWIILSHYAQTDWTDAGAVTITGTSVNPAKGTSTNIVDKVWWRRIGQNAEIRVEYRHTTQGTATGGTGDYLFAVPSNMTIDTAKLTVYATAEGTGAFLNNNACGACTAGQSTSSGAGAVSVYDTTNVRLYVVFGGTGGVVGSTVFTLGGADTHYCFSYSVPITGWKP